MSDDAEDLWERLLPIARMRWMPSHFRSFVLSGIHGGSDCPDDAAQPAPTRSEAARPLWPMPPPFPELLSDLLRPVIDNMEDTAAPVKKAVNMTVLLLSWLHVRRRPVCPTSARAGRRLSDRQLKSVEHLASVPNPFLECGRLDLSSLGQSASKIDSVLSALVALQSKADSINSELHPYSPHSKKAPHDFRVPGFSYGRDSSQVVGHLDGTECDPSCDVDPSKLTFSGTPSFSPVGLYSDELATAFLDPDSLLVERPPDRLPVVRVRASQSAQVQLWQKLDCGSRLALFRRDQVSFEHRSGAFDVQKDAENTGLLLTLVGATRWNLL